MPQTKPDKLDLMILEKLDENVRSGAKQIAHALKSRRQVVDYRIKRMEKRGIIANYRMLANFSKLGLIYHRLHIKLGRCSLSEKETIISYFVKNLRTNWVVECDGRYDLMVGIFTNNVIEFQDLLFSFVSAFSQKIDYYDFVRLIEILASVRDFSKTRKSRGLRGAVVDDSKPEKISLIDKKIINILAENGKMPIVDIAKTIHEPVEKVKYHLRKILKNKVLFSNIQYGYNLLGFELYKTLFYLSDPNRERIEKLKSFGRSYPRVWNSQEAQGKWQIEMDIEAKNHEDYFKIMDEIMSRFYDIIKNYDTLFVRNERKFLFAVFQDEIT